MIACTADGHSAAQYIRMVDRSVAQMGQSVLLMVLCPLLLWIGIALKDVAMVGPLSVNSNAFIPKLALICLVLECSIHRVMICM